MCSSFIVAFGGDRLGMNVDRLTADLASTASHSPLVKPGIRSIVIDYARSESVTFGETYFGSVGQYEKIRGTAYGEIDPSDPQNTVITDLEFAPINPRGLVDYSMDIFILKPKDLDKGNHRILFDFNNRGQMRVGKLNDAVLTNDPSTPEDAGTGFIMNLGYTVVSNGWDLGAEGFLDMKINVPLATRSGNSISGRSYEYIVFDNSTSSTYSLAYPAENSDKSKARLTVRERLDDTALEVPATEWDYTSSDRTAIKLLPDGMSFKQSYIYEFTYNAIDPLVAGVGLAATRDFVSFLRHGTIEEGNPLAGDVKYTFSYSISQPSRTLNDFQELGFNQDLDGQPVFDGILSHTGGGNGGQINYRFAQTGRTERNRQNHLYPEAVFPFAHQVMTDNLTGKIAGRSQYSVDNGTCPKRLEVNTSNEYWVKACSLLHTDTEGNDISDPENVRFYLLSGLSHGVGKRNDKGKGQQYTNPVSPYAAHRALLIALDQWVTDGTTPPNSLVPRRTENAAMAVPVLGSQTGFVPQDELGWPSIPGVVYNGLITTRYLLDFGPEFDNGILDNYPPSVVGCPAYTIFVSKVDGDGNEMAGIRLPAVAAPVATTTGWGLRREGYGENEGLESDGQYIPFEKTRSDRISTGDPRLSLKERYGDHEGYVAAVERVARELEKQRFLLPVDVKKYIDEARSSDIFA